MQENGDKKEEGGGHGHGNVMRGGGLHVDLEELQHYPEQEGEDQEPAPVDI